MPGLDLCGIIYKDKYDGRYIVASTERWENIDIN